MCTVTLYRLSKLSEHALNKLLLFLFFVTDEKGFRGMIVWLEDQKVRHYKIEDRAALRNIESQDWPKAFESVSRAEAGRNFVLRYLVYLVPYNTRVQWPMLGSKFMKKMTSPSANVH